MRILLLAVLGVFVFATGKNIGKGEKVTTPLNRSWVSSDKLAPPPDSIKEIGKKVFNST